VEKVTDPQISVRTKIFSDTQAFQPNTAVALAILVSSVLARLMSWTASRQMIFRTVPIRVGAGIKLIGGEGKDRD
jgi:hypothetical protein